MNKGKVKKVALSIAAILMIGVSASNATDSISWGTTSLNRAYALDTVTLLPGNASSSIGGFVQLLYLGTDATYNGFITSGTGVVGDDVVVQTSWVGSASMAASGQFGGSYEASTLVGSKYLIRFFDTASVNYAGGALPTSGYYGLSQVFTQAGDPNLGGTDSFTFNQNYSVTTAVVPEPSTVALMLAGLGVLGFARFRRK